MEFIKRLISPTLFYKEFQHFRLIKSLRQWTAHDQEMLEFYSQFVRHGTLCFDIGANIGNRTKIFLKLGANVVAVEPQDECISILRSVFGNNRNLSIVSGAVGSSEGEAEIIKCNSNTISSLSPEWIEAVTKSGRFSGYKWTEKKIVPMTTLNKLIAKYGKPIFIKIDVEGFEFQVIRGLSQPIRTISFEFTPEYIESAYKCINLLSVLGEVRLNYSIGEEMKLILEDWITAEDMKKILSNFSDNKKIFGDIYVKSYS